jgi:hypothetical protein
MPNRRWSDGLSARQALITELGDSERAVKIAASELQ